MFTAFEQQVVLGTFTHRDTYYPALIESASVAFPGVDFILHVEQADIKTNMAALREKFLATGKRWCVYLDDDIQFHRDGHRLLHNVVRDMLEHKWALCGVYSTFEPEFLGESYVGARWQVHDLFQEPVRPVPFIPGYFIAVDMREAGYLMPDMELPDGNTAVDTSFCVAALARGHGIGISDGIVYHTKKDGTWVDGRATVLTRAYTYQRWGDFYQANARYSGNVIEWEQKLRNEEEESCD